eukprot:TRINITY_DN70737_c0_g1_i1.p1 TRINITY_DN70737_c0_g1~~TRINITY_DN70737_c0_g1_i1.p1  ORF type:complete len:1013 (-),score=163.71 TRINITY_DN70737_c0_g1_i1:12-3050(-)
MLSPGRKVNTLSIARKLSAAGYATTNEPVQSYIASDDEEEEGPVNDDSVHVTVRLRPFIKEEIARGDASTLCVSMPTKRTLEILDSGENASPQSFCFDRTYWSHDADHEHYATQDTLYRELGVSMLRQALRGFNTCIFAYGQTGSGKSYSVIGGEAEESRGLLPRIVDGLFQHLERSPEGSTWSCMVSFMEIYNERIRDLISAEADPMDLKVRSHPVLGSTVVGLTDSTVTTREDVMELIAYGLSHRTVGATAMNFQSSRSHCIFTFKTSSTSDKDVTKVSQTHVVDLAGSERAGRTQAHGERLKEGVAINLSLSTLARVIKALAENASKAGKKLKNPPFRDSKLTFVLKESLSGNSRTYMMAAISPSVCDFEESMSTLRFAHSVKQVKLKAVANEMNAGNERAVEAQLQEELERMKEQLSQQATMHAVEVARLKEKANQVEEQRLLVQSLGRPQNYCQSARGHSVFQFGRVNAGDASMRRRQSDGEDSPGMPQTAQMGRVDTLLQELMNSDTDSGDGISESEEESDSEEEEKDNEEPGPDPMEMQALIENLRTDLAAAREEAEELRMQSSLLGFQQNKDIREDQKKEQAEEEMFELKRKLAETEFQLEDVQRQFEEAQATHDAELQRLHEADRAKSEEIQRLRDADFEKSEELQRLRVANSADCSSSQELTRLREADRDKLEELQRLHIENCANAKELDATQRQLRETSQRYEEELQSLRRTEHAQSQDIARLKALCEQQEEELVRLQSLIGGANSGEHSTVVWDSCTGGTTTSPQLDTHFDWSLPPASESQPSQSKARRGPQPCRFSDVFGRSPAQSISYASAAKLGSPSFKKKPSIRGPLPARLSVKAASPFAPVSLSSLCTESDESRVSRGLSEPPPRKRAGLLSLWTHKNELAKLMVVLEEDKKELAAAQMEAQYLRKQLEAHITGGVGSHSTTSPRHANHDKEHRRHNHTSSTTSGFEGVSFTSVMAQLGIGCPQFPSAPPDFQNPPSSRDRHGRAHGHGERTVHR